MTKERDPPPWRRRGAWLSLVAVAAWILAAVAPLMPAPAYAAGITKVQSGTYFQNGNTKNLVVTMAASTPGTLLVLMASMMDTAGSLVPPANWVKATAISQASNGRNEIWYYPNNPGGITGVRSPPRA